ncbi:GNAT family N-acetyltransferase [Promicromonospora sp. NPDC090134]|uniref:GNAT family N-acetyltransferase n=1 Tax=Promicromonospora sp. NPDC090134 TaxID=3364408 RepID=UPI0037FD540A
MYTSTKSRNVLVIVPSTRPGRRGPVVSDWFTSSVAGRASELQVRCTVADLAEIGLPFLDEPEEPSTGRYVHEHTRRWSELVEGSDAFVVCTPEYNHAMPAALKNAFDALSAEWAHKPVAFVSYGNTSAGTRAAQMAKSVAVTLGMVPVSATVNLRIADSFAGEGLVADPRRDASAVRILDELHELAGLLDALRVPGRTRVDGAGPAGLTIAPARDVDAGELLVLQRCCWVDEALANTTLDIHALHEPLDVVLRGIREQATWVVRDGARIVGAVRAQSRGTTWEIGRLMVAPDHRGRGLGRYLLSWAENQAPKGTERFELFTGAMSTRNLRLYGRAGYHHESTSAGVAHLVKAVARGTEPVAA